MSVVNGYTGFAGFVEIDIGTANAHLTLGTTVYFTDRDTSTPDVIDNIEFRAGNDPPFFMSQYWLKTDD
jgi:hypothetical protein